MLAGQIVQKIPLNEILHRVRRNFCGSLKRLHLVTMKDLGNIASSFQLSKPERLHRDDATSVHAFVESCMSTANSPVILYKRQDVSSIDISTADVSEDWKDVISDDDFLLGFMDQSQAARLKRYGNGPTSVVCVDSTHGTNSYDFQLMVVLILDDNGEGFPVAFLFSNRQNEDTYRLFFECMKQKAGLVS